MKSAYDSMPVLRMSLENVARDFHLHVMTQHQEIQKYIEENLQAVVDKYIETEMPKLVHDIVRDAARQVVDRKVNGYRGEDEEIRQRIDKACDLALRKYLDESAGEVAETAMYTQKDALKDKVKQSQIWRVLRAITGGQD